MQIPQIDPSGCDVIVWMLENEVYFAEVTNGVVYMVNDCMLEHLIESFPEGWTIGILMPLGNLARVGKNRLQ